MSKVISFVDKFNSKNKEDVKSFEELDNLSKRKISTKVRVYPKELKIVLGLINHEIKDINREILISERYNQKDTIKRLSHLLSIFENLKNIIINSNSMGFIKDLNFEELDCFLGVIEIKLQEYELLEIQEITGVDVNLKAKLLELHQKILPIYAQKKASI